MQFEIRNFIDDNYDEQSFINLSDIDVSLKGQLKVSYYYVGLEDINYITFLATLISSEELQLSINLHFDKKIMDEIRKNQHSFQELIKLKTNYEIRKLESGGN